MKKTKIAATCMNKNKPIAELVSKRDHRTLAIWAADCAEHVLPYFEEKYPKDNRPRKAIEAGRAWVCGEISVSGARTQCCQVKP